ncbi:MAG: sigma-54 dependent transcriptional regulator [Polyangiales bacterium]
MSAKILIVDDDRAMCELLADSLRKQGHAAQWRATADEALAALGAEDFDVVVTDLNMPKVGGIELCARVAANRPDIPVIVLTAFGSLDAAVQAIRAGAYDFVTKPVRMGVVGLAVDRAVQHKALREEVRRLRLAVASETAPGGFIGRSPAMQRVYDLLDRVADSESTVLVTGESGTGKEVLARALHARSRRREGPFVAFNAAAMPEALAESELFGHVKGAFTDARTARPGLFMQAHDGTIFLDEIGDMPLALQTKLLRALQERCVRPVGATIEIPFDARVVAATNRDLELAVEEKRFREDLYFRLDVIHVQLPPLRARGGDVLLLAQHFLEHFARRAGKRVTTLSAAVAKKLVEYDWPGNVRELQNTLERAVALARYDAIGLDDLPERIVARGASHVVVVADDPSELVSLEEVERRYVLRVVEAVGGNRSHAARILGLDRKTLRRKLERYGLGDPDEDDKG